MRDPEDDPRLKELLRQVEAVDIPDYPDWKKGRRWGLTAGVAAPGGGRRTGREAERRHRAEGDDRGDAGGA